MARITLNSVTKRFEAAGIRTTAVRDVSLEIQSGEFVSIMGPSGSGKSTLLSLIGLLDLPSTGEILIGDKSADGLGQRGLDRIRTESIGFVFQGFYLIDDLTVRANVELPLVYRAASADERRSKVETALQQVGLTARAGHYPFQLSGGQKQRVALARALVANPKILLADEPTGNLDSKTGLEVMDLIASINKAGSTVVLVTHSHRDAEYATRTITMSEGEISV